MDIRPFHLPGAVVVLASDGTMAIAWHFNQPADQWYVSSIADVELGFDALALTKRLSTTKMPKEWKPPQPT